MIKLILEYKCRVRSNLKMVLTFPLVLYLIDEPQRHSLRFYLYYT